MKLKFQQNGIVDGVVVYEEGKVYEVDNSNGSADRWIKRGAQVVEGDEEVSEPAHKPVEEVKPTHHERRSQKRNKKGEDKAVETVKDVTAQEEEKVVEVKEDSKVADQAADDALDALSADEDEVVNADVKEENK